MAVQATAWSCLCRVQVQGQRPSTHLHSRHTVEGPEVEAVPVALQAAPQEAVGVQQRVLGRVLACWVAPCLTSLRVLQRGLRLGR